MGSVAPPFILCPLSESKELVGITPDRLENRVIVTLGKNIAIRYHVLEQKQEASWTCSRHWLTSPVVFCPDFEKYGAIIDNSQVALWDENDAHLTSRKKYKFPDPIHMLHITSNETTLIIFKNGTVRSLSDAITNRSIPGLPILDESTEIIDDVVMDEKGNYIFLVSRRKPAQKPTSRCGVEKAKALRITTLKCPTSSEREGNESMAWEETGNTVRVSPVGEEILGRSVVVAGNSSAFVYLCSDGYLYRRFLQSNSDLVEKIQDVDETETKIAYIGKYISKSTPAILSSLNASTIVVYGCDPSEEGATVFIYDINYDLMLSKQSLKLFGSPAIMFTVGNNVFVPVGLHILVLGLRLTKSLLSSLVGQHQIRGLDFFENRDPWKAKAWEEDNDFKLKEIKDDDDTAVTVDYSGFEDLVTLVKTLESNGQPQSSICGQIVPKILENGSSAAINWAIDYFCDIPEFLLVNLLAYLLLPMERTEKRAVKVEPLDELLPIENNTTGLSNGSVTNPDTIYIYPSQPQIDRLLIRPFDHKQMIQSLRALEFEIAKKFLEYLINRMESSWNFEFDSEVESTNEISQLLKWTCTILDTHYPQFVFHDETVLVGSLLSLLREKFAFMDEIETLEPLLTLTMTKTSYEPGPSPSSKYRCETVVFD